MKGVAVHASSKDDPYITKHEDSEDEYEKDDFVLKDTDNLVVVAKMVKVICFLHMLFVLLYFIG